MLVDAPRPRAAFVDFKDDQHMIGKKMPIEELFVPHYGHVEPAF